MPTPSRSETKSHYMARCVPYVMKEKGTKSNDHAVAKCNGMWEQSRKRTNNARRMNPLRLDPTRTTMIRRRFETDMKRRFDKFKRALWSLVVEEDAFGLTPRKPLVLHQRYAALMTPQQLEEFRRWVQGQVDQGILGRTRPGEPNWLQQYISESYEKGQGRAFDDAMKKYGYGGQAPPEYYQGSRDQFLRSSFRQPASVERVELLASRSFTDLKNVTEGMSTQLNRTLTDGIIQGRSPREVGRDLNKVVDGYKNRGLTIARTETIRAHADGQLEALKQLGVEEVGVMVEWSAAADDLVCDLCRELDGAVFKLQEAQAIIPRHPNCRCSWIPANVGEPEKGQKRGKEAQKVLDESIKQEIPKGKREERTLEEQKKISRWAGADKKVQKPLTPKVSPQDKAKPKTLGTPKPRVPRKMSPTRKPSTKPPQPIGDWKAEAVLDAAERTPSNATTLPELYAKLKAKHPGLTVEEFQKGMLDLHREGKLCLLEYTRAPAEIAGKLQILNPAGDPYYYVQKPALWQGRKQ